MQKKLQQTRRVAKKIWGVMGHDSWWEGRKREKRKETIRKAEAIVINDSGSRKFWFVCKYLKYLLKVCK